MNRVANINTLRAAAVAGTIDDLYAVIETDPSILVNIDSEQFVETPLHIAALEGHLPFAIEIMNLKPSFALKLNPQGLSPIHLAMQQVVPQNLDMQQVQQLLRNRRRMVFLFVVMNKELVRVKGRGCMTPLHLASEIGDVEYLAEFLTACPDSIEDVTVRGETALHIALRRGNNQVLKLLICFLKKNRERGARQLECKILNWKDGDGNTILHISTLNNQQEALQLLVDSGVNLKAKNFDRRTALRIAVVPEVRRILICAGAKEVVTDGPTLAEKLLSTITIMNKVPIYVCRFRNDILDQQRNIWLIIATLVATATYQSILSPPGGFYQADATVKNSNITSSNSTISSKAGKSVLSSVHFIVFSHLNIFSFVVSTMAILVMTPWGVVGSTLVFGPVAWFLASYLYSMWVISPGPFNFKTHVTLGSLLGLVLVSLISIVVLKQLTRLQRQRVARRQVIGGV